MTEALSYGPRLVAHPTGALRAAAAVLPSVAIERARPLPGEPGAVAARAQAQMAVLARTLRYFSCDVTLLDAPTADPYASAIVDAAVVFENGAVMMRPSSMSRRPESAWLEKTLSERDIPIAGHISAPGLLDGSDVVMLGTTAFVAAGPRGNALGRAGFGAIAKAHGFDVREITLAPEAPHLRAVMSAVDSRTVVFNPRVIDASALEGLRTIAAPIDEPLGAGVLNLGENHVLADIRYPATINALRKAGTTVEAIDLYDFGRIGLTPSVLVVDLKRA